MTQCPSELDLLLSCIKLHICYTKVVDDVEPELFCIHITYASKIKSIIDLWNGLLQGMVTEGIIGGRHVVGMLDFEDRATWLARAQLCEDTAE